MISKCLHERNLTCGERHDLPPSARDRTDWLPVSNDGDCHNGPIAERALQHLARARIISWIGEHILKLYRDTVDEGTTHREIAIWLSREQTVEGRPLCG